MKKLILIAVIAAVAWQVQAHYRAARPSAPHAPTASTSTSASQQTAPSPFQCDGRTHCSQMSSCAEANYFLQNCPGVKMDGDHDGIPCEQQWCH